MIVFMLVGVVVFFVQRNRYYYNKLVENEYLKRIVNDSGFNIEEIKKNWSGEIIRQNNGIYILKLNTVNHSFFIDSKHNSGATDFYGYELHVKNGRITGIYFYKP